MKEGVKIHVDFYHGHGLFPDVSEYSLIASHGGMNILFIDLMYPI